MDKDAVFQRIVESAPISILLVETGGQITYVNRKTEDLFGYDRGKLLGQSIEILIPERYRTQHVSFRKEFTHAQKHRSLGEGMKLYALHKNNDEFPVEIGLNPMLNSAGDLVTLVSIIDITQRKKADDRFKKVVEAAPNAMVLVNIKGKITMVNNEAEKLFGYTRAEMVLNDLEILIPKKYREGHKNMHLQLFSNPQSRSLGAGRELLALRKDGSEFPAEIGISPVETEEGMMMLASVTDITERKKLEESQHEIELIDHRLTDAQEMAHLGNWEFDFSTGNYFWSDELFRILGYVPGSVVPSRMIFLGRVHPEDKNMVEKRINLAQKDMKDFRYSFRVIHPGGAVRYLYDSIKFEFNDTGEPSKLIGTSLDVTDLTLKQVALEKANRELATYIYRTSHDLRGPIASALGILNMAKSDLEDEQALSYVDSLYKVTQHLDEIITRLNDVMQIKEKDLAPEWVNLKTLIYIKLDKLRRVEGYERVTFHVDYEGPEEIFIDRVLLKNILYSLLENTIKHQKPEPFETRADVIVKTPDSGSGEIVIEIKDNGIGIREDRHDKIFDMFYRTGEDYNATGLGLYIARTSIEKLGGILELESKENEGSIFRVKIIAAARTAL